jgi:hypothetical protein
MKMTIPTAETTQLDVVMTAESKNNDTQYQTKHFSGQDDSDQFISTINQEKEKMSKLDPIVHQSIIVRESRTSRKE